MAIASTTTSSSFMSMVHSASSSMKTRNKKENPAHVSYAAAAVAGTMYSSRSKGFDRVFHFFDENGDGKISPSELWECMKVAGEEISLEEAEAVVQSADSDGDGLLGFDDFVALVDDRGDEDKERSLREAFEAYVMKGEGCITAKSLRKALRRLGDLRSIKECKTMIGKFDADGDGVLSFEEFEKMMN